MSKLDRFFRDMAFLFLGIMVGFLCAPIRKGVNITIASNNTGERALRASDEEAEFEYDNEDDLPPEEITVE